MHLGCLLYLLCNKIYFFIIHFGSANGSKSFTDCTTRDNDGYIGLSHFIKS